MTGFKETIDQINRTTDPKERELLQQRLDEMHSEADKKSKEFEDLIRGDWSDWNE